MTRTTRKKGATSRKSRPIPTTIPELKRSFDALERATADILRSKATGPQRIKKFQAAWKRIFGKPVDAHAADAYLRVKSRGGKKTRKAQKGGASWSPADAATLDYTTRPGVYGTYGSFPAYVGSGMSFYNTINQQGMFKDCGVKDITPQVPADLGSNKVGGGIIQDAFRSLTSAPIESSSPPSIAFDAQTTWHGRSANLPASPDPAQNPLKYM